MIQFFNETNHVHLNRLILNVKFIFIIKYFQNNIF